MNPDLRLLLLSNGRGEHGLLSHALARIKDLLRDRRSAVFLPFASVQASWVEYRDRVAVALAPVGVDLHAPLDPGTARELLREPGAVIVGGGNTFQLLRTVRAWELIGPLRDAVLAGAPYIGWSAGANLACPTIRTTNDMPIVDPVGFEALDLVNFQINPHFVDGGLTVHSESRRQRIDEFTRLNPQMPVMGLPEGTYLETRGASMSLGGAGGPAKWFIAGAEPIDVPLGAVRARRPDGVFAGPRHDPAS